MSQITDQTYLLTNQYHNAANLNDRIQLHARFSTNTYGWHLWVFDQLQLAPRSRILELGCGPGRLWLQNVERIPEGWDITLSDFSRGMLEEAQRNLSGSQRPLAFEVVDVQAIPFADASFDAVIANHMLYHVPDRPTALSEIRRVLRPGGRFYASTVGETHLRQMEELVRRFDSKIAAWGGRGTDSFKLENGFEQLARYFSRVVLHRYEDALIVTETAPLVAFVASEDAAGRLAGDRRAEFAAFVEGEIAEHGPIHFTKDSGLFESYNDA
jgi:ubiquinone/menaquinone biosynthesis C-methylase UbiE